MQAQILRRIIGDLDFKNYIDSIRRVDQRRIVYIYFNEDVYTVNLRRMAKKEKEFAYNRKLILKSQNENDICLAKKIVNLEKIQHVDNVDVVYEKLQNDEQFSEKVEQIVKFESQAFSNFQEAINTKKSSEIMELYKQYGSSLQNKEAVFILTEIIRKFHNEGDHLQKHEALIEYNKIKQPIEYNASDCKIKFSPPIKYEEEVVDKIVVALKNKYIDLYIDVQEKFGGIYLKSMKPEGEFIFAQEIKNGVRRPFYMDNIESMCKETTIIVHEVCAGATKFFLDLDDKKGFYTKTEFKSLVENLREEFMKFFPAYFELKGELFFNFLISYGNGYNSAHVTIEIILNKRYIFSKTAADQSTFWSSFIKNNTQFSKIVDLLVYRKNTQLRVPECINKNGFRLCPEHCDIYFLKNTPKEVIKFIKDDKNGDAMISDGIHFYEKYFEEIQGIIREDIRLVPKGTKGMFRDESFTTYTSSISMRKSVYDDFLIHCNKDSNDSIKIENIFVDTYRPMPVYTTYERLRFENILKNSSIDITRYHDWRNACYKIFSVFHTENSPKRIIDFCKSKGFDKPEHIKENEDLFHLMSGVNPSPYGLKSFEEYFKPKSDAIKFTAPKLDYNFFGDDRIICIKSGADTGKSTGFIKKFADKRVLCVTYRVSLADELVRNANFLGVDFAHYKQAKGANDGRSVVCQLESLTKYEDQIHSFDVIFFDESESLCGQFTHFHKTQPKNFAKLLAMVNYIMEEKKIFFVSANLADETLNFIEIFEQKAVFYQNTFLDKQDWSYIKYEKGLDDYIFEVIMPFLRDNKNILVPINNLVAAMEIHRHVSKEKKCLLVTRDTEKVPIEEWNNYQCVIYSPTVESGVNILGDHFDYICCYFVDSANSYKSCYQMAFRCRTPKIKDVYICLFCTRYQNIVNESDTEHEIQRIMEAESLETQCTKEKLGFSDKMFSYKYKDNLSKVIAYHHFFCQYSMKNFRNLLFQEFKKSGMIEKEFETISSYCPREKFTEKGQKQQRISAHNTKIIIDSINKEIPANILVKKMRFKKLPVEEDKTEEEIFNLELSKNLQKTKEKNKTKALEYLYNYYAIKQYDKNKSLYLTNKQAILYKFIFLRKRELGPEEYINEFMKEHYETFTAIFKGKKKFNLNTFLATKLQSKIKFINNKLKECCFEFLTAKNKFAEINPSLTTMLDFDDPVENTVNEIV